MANPAVGGHDDGLAEPHAHDAHCARKQDRSDRVLTIGVARWSWRMTPNRLAARGVSLSDSEASYRPGPAAGRWAVVLVSW